MAGTVVSMIDQILYISRTSQDFESDDLEAILLCCRRNNFELAVTGALTMIDDWFLQVLEGPSDTLDMLIGLIGTDRRHREMRILARQSVERRSFPDWSMGHVLTEGAKEEWRALVKAAHRSDTESDAVDTIMVRLRDAKLSGRTIVDRV